MCSMSVIGATSADQQSFGHFLQGIRSGEERRSLAISAVILVALQARRKIDLSRVVDVRHKMDFLQTDHITAQALKRDTSMG